MSSWMCVGYRCALAAILCLVYDGAQAYKPITEALHHYMSPDELGYYFGEASHLTVPDYEVVYLIPTLTVLPDEAEAVTIEGEDNVFEGHQLNYDFKAFGRDVALKLRPNRHLIAPNFQVIRREEGSPEGYSHIPGPVPRCHYIHQDQGIIAAISICQERDVHGFVMLENDTLEIRALTPRLHALLLADSLDHDSHGRVPHIIRRAPLIGESFHGDSIPILAQRAIGAFPDVFQSRRRKRATKARYTIETAMFFDEAGYKLFTPYFKNDEKKMRDLLLAYMNGVQALYHHPSLGESINIALVRLEIFKSQPSDMPHYQGERGQLLDSFCLYSQKHNPKDDTNPDHWDMAVYISGLDFYAIENGRKSGVTMGLATVGGVCMDRYACLIAELGTTNAFGKPYPSAGFTSVYVLAHEMGHNLGMHHDGSGNSCPTEGYIMSPSRGTQGETLWSRCSVNVVRDLSWAKCLTDAPKKPKAEVDHAKFLDEPGQAWGAKKQCEILLRDKDAHLQYPDQPKDVCQNLKCKTPHRSGFYFAGPALEGTNCGRGLWCQGGECVVMERKPPEKVVKGGWGKWVLEDCKSGCIVKSKGAQGRRRTCDNPKPINSEEGCEGASVGAVFCSDNKMCKKKRQSVTDHATARCKEFSKLIPDLDSTGQGLQAPHESARMWMGCAIFCKRKDTGGYYTPRLDLNDLGVDAYFPDGTWCHNDGKMSHYCLQHHCLPENFSFGKSLLGLAMGTEDVPLPQNAPPRLIPLSGDLLKYLSLGKDGRPLLTTLKPGSTKPPAEEEWSNHDYLELPKKAAEENSIMFDINE